MIKQMTDQEYNKIEALRNSDLKNFMISPSFYKYKLEQSKVFTSKGMRLGTVLHKMLLEPDLVEKDIEVCIKYKTDQGEGFKKLFQYYQEEENKLLVLEREFNTATTIYDKLSRVYPTLFTTIQKSITELVVVGDIEGVRVKAKLDIYDEESKTIIDLKTTGNPVDQIKDTIKKFRYDVQQVHYTEVANAAGMEVNYFNFLFCETEFPNNIALVSIDPVSIKQTEEEYITSLRGFRECLKTNTWLDRPIIKEIITL